MAASRGQIDQLMSDAWLCQLSEVLSLCDERGEGSDWPVPGARSRPVSTPALLLGRPGALALHIGEYVYSLLCEKNDLCYCPPALRIGSMQASIHGFAVLRVFDSPQVPTFVRA